MINKIEALIRKAESTDSPAEAETYLAKAQELMVRYAIDEAQLNKAQNVKESVISVEVSVHAPRALGGNSMMRLMRGVGDANSLEVLNITGTGRAWLIGFPSDIERARQIFAVLSVQMQSSELQSRRNKPEWENGRSWKTSFYEGFASRMRMRLIEARQTAVADADADNGGGSALVLADRSSAAAAYMKQNFRVSYRSSRSSSRGSGHGAGRAAADRADMGQSRMGQRGRISA